MCVVPVLQRPVIALSTSMPPPSAYGTVSLLKSSLQRLKTHLFQQSFCDDNNADDKSEVVLLGTPAQLRSATNITTVDVAGSTLSVVSKLKSLGVTIDSNLRFDCHARNVAKACNFHTRALRHVRSRRRPDSRVQHRRFQA